MTVNTEPKTRATPSRKITLAVAIIVLQAFAATFFVIDSIDEVVLKAREGITTEVILECLIALALLAGVGISAWLTRKLIVEARRRDEALATAKGALADVINLRFQEWNLSSGESEVALFAIKGCSVAEIAQLRGAATGTVRSQLSQIYAKARVTSQSMLVSLFIEELL